jgi:hypothetical protein
MADTSRINARFTGTHATDLSDDGQSLRFRLDNNIDLEIPRSRIGNIILYLATADRTLERMHI